MKTAVLQIIFSFCFEFLFGQEAKNTTTNITKKEEQNLIFMINDRICTCMLLKLWKCEKMIKSSQKKYDL